MIENIQISNEFLLISQVISILTYVGIIFGLYALMIKQKNSTIELLKEKNDFLSTKLNDALSHSPDILVDNLSKRVDILKSEVKDLNKDRNNNLKLIQEKESTIAIAEQSILDLNNQIEKTKQLFEEHTCPYCNAMPTVRHYYPIYGFIGDRECEAEGEYVEYECGLILNNGEEQNACANNAQ